jgi:hypothetical protein
MSRSSQDLILCLILILFCGVQSSEAQKGKKQEPGPAISISMILGRPTDQSVTLSVLSEASGDAYAEWGTRSGEYSGKSAPVPLRAGAPSEIEMDGLQPDTPYFYRLHVRRQSGAYRSDAVCSFHTARAQSSTFAFGVQGDSHPERKGKMFDANLYVQTMNNVARDHPDFYVTMGDDFSIEHLIDSKMLSQENVDSMYAYQRGFLGLVGRFAPLFLVNGNHEQAARYLLDGTDSNAAVMAGRARNKFYPLPSPGGFYSGDMQNIGPIGLLRDYYSWTWGDALFVVIDPYWHSPVPVDNRAGVEGRGEGKRGDKTKREGKDKRDLWQATLGEEQYRWLTQTLSASKARWKFVFAHHVNGTGRGGIEEADLYEWGGKDRNGKSLFKEKRPTWLLPIHALMAKTGVTIFFQGHDHLYAHQELDGIVYQSAPNPADPTYQAFNKDAYRSGDILPNSGYLRVTVSPEAVRVDYVRSFLPADEGEGRTNGMVGRSYAINRRNQK